MNDKVKRDGDVKIVENNQDPYEKLASLLGKLTFNGSIRKIAEKHALRETERRNSSSKDVSES